MTERGKGLGKWKPGAREAAMDARIKAIAERERAKAGKPDDLVIRHDPSIVRKPPR